MPKKSQKSKKSRAGRRRRARRRAHHNNQPGMPGHVDYADEVAVPQEPVVHSEQVEGEPEPIVEQGEGEPDAGLAQDDLTFLDDMDNVVAVCGDLVLKEHVSFDTAGRQACIQQCYDIMTVIRAVKAGGVLPAIGRAALEQQFGLLVARDPAFGTIEILDASSTEMLEGLYDHLGVVRQDRMSKIRRCNEAHVIAVGIAKFNNDPFRHFGTDPATTRLITNCAAHLYRLTGRLLTDIVQNETTPTDEQMTSVEFHRRVLTERHPDIPERVAFFLQMSDRDQLALCRNNGFRFN